MPISLLLQETVYTFRWGAFHLKPWIHLVRTEEVLIDRARSAFLTHWFGSGLPLNGSFVKIVIDNLKELRERYFMVAQSLLPVPEGSSLREPLAGLLGEITGIALSPTGGLLFIAVAVRNLRYWTKLLVGVLGWKVALLPLEPLIGPLVGPLLLPVALFEQVVLIVNNPAEVRGVYGLLGSAARFLIAATRFLKLLMGPRENIANPLLKHMLGMFDRLAGLLPFALAFIAVVVTRIGPLLEPLMAQLGPFESLIDEVVATVGFIIGDIKPTIDRYLPAIADQIDFVLVQLSLIFPVWGIALTELFTNLSESINGLVEKLTQKIKDWYDATKVAAIKIVMSQPVSLRMQSAAISFGIASRVLSSGTPPSGASSPRSSGSALPPSFPKPNLTSPEDYLRSIGGPPPGGLGAIETLGKIDIKYGGALFGDHIPFSEVARAGVAEGIRPTHVFGGERGELVRQLGQPEKALAALRVDQLKLRDLLSAVVGRVLPPELRVQMGNLLDTFRRLDQNLYEMKVKRQDYPIRDLPDNGQLRPIVHRLVIRGTDIARTDLDTFQARLQEAMNGQNYPATSAAQGMALQKG